MEEEEEEEDEEETCRRRRRGGGEGYTMGKQSAGLTFSASTGTFVTCASAPPSFSHMVMTSLTLYALGPASVITLLQGQTSQVHQP